jgi:hypothetical protein
MANEDRMQTVAGALEQLGRRGFDRDLSVVGGRLRVTGSDRSYGPDEVRIAEHRRFEGVSDPDDTSVVYAIETRDGPKGTLVDAFGAYADPAVAEFLASVPVVQPSVKDPAPTPQAFERSA